MRQEMINLKRALLEAKVAGLGDKDGCGAVMDIFMRISTKPKAVERMNARLDEKQEELDAKNAAKANGE